MASDATTIAVLDPAMKVIANEPLVNNILAESQMADLFTEDGNIQVDQTTGGRYTERAHITGLPAGVGARAENDNLPEADNPSFINSRIYLRSVYGVIEMTGHTMRRVVGDEGSFLAYGREAFPLFAKRVASEWDRMSIGYGFGIICRTNGTPTLVSGTTYTIPLNRAFGVTGYTGVARLLLKGQRLVFSATAAVSGGLRNAGTAQSAKVISVNFDTDVVTVDMDAALAAAIASGDYVLSGDAAGHSGQASGVNREPQGVLAGADDGGILATYLNVTRANEDAFKATVIDSQSATLGFGGALTEDLLVYADETVQLRCGEKLDVIVTSMSGKRSYWKDLKKDRMFVNQRRLVGGKGEPIAVDLGDREVPLRIARKIPDEATFGLTKAHWKKFMLRMFEWDDKTGTIWNRVVTTSGRQDRFYAVGFMDLEIASRWPQANFRIDNLIKVY